MRRLVYILVLVSSLGFAQGVEVFNAMDILEYNESLRIFQKVKNDVVDEYEVTFISAQRSLVIRRGSTGDVMEFADVRVFREENGLFVFSGWLVVDRRYPVSGLMYSGGLRINLGDMIYIFENIKLDGKL